MKARSLVVQQSRCQNSRTLAGLLYEFTMPGMRRGEEFQARPGTKKEKKRTGCLQQKATFKLTSEMINWFDRNYRGDEFAKYVEVHNNDSLLERSLPRDGTRRIIDDPEQKEILLVDLMHHYRCSYAIFDWMHSGNNSWRIGNRRRRIASQRWICSDDETRRDCLLNIEKEERPPFDDTEQSLNQLTKIAYGQDYEMRIRTKLKKLRWLCETQGGDKKAKRKPLQLAYLTPEDATYLMDLYRL